VPLRVESFENLDRKFLDDPKEPLLWELKIKSKKRQPVERIKLTAFELTRLFESYSAVQGEELSIELTARKASNLEFIVATNSLEIAESSLRTKLIWQRDCQNIIHQAYVVGRPGRLNIKLCNLTGEPPKTTYTIQPSSKTDTRHTVIYECTFVPRTSYVPSLSKPVSEVPCHYGYTALSGEALPKITVPTDFAPGTPNHQTKELVLKKLQLYPGTSTSTLLETRFSDLPFGSEAGCHTLKVDVKYETFGGYQTARLMFKRSDTKDGAPAWIPQDSGSWPSLDSIVKYYKGAKEEKITLYRVCDWSADSGSDSVAIN
jgi:hypothetical protein